MPEITLEGARLILDGWLESAVSLFVGVEGQPGGVRGRFKVLALTDGGVELKAETGDAGLLIDLLSYETVVSYREPREYVDREEYKEWVAAMSESERMTSCLSFAFSVRVEGPPPFEPLSVPMGKVVMIELAQ
jgi:hypothetical protein